jgi:predicted small metal-binding protein
MRTELECGSVVPGCNFVARAGDEAELMMKMADHARAVHGIERLSPDLRAKLAAAIRSESERTSRPAVPAESGRAEQARW